MSIICKTLLCIVKQWTWIWTDSQNKKFTYMKSLKFKPQYLSPFSLKLHETWDLVWLVWALPLVLLIGLILSLKKIIKQQAYGSISGISGISGYIYVSRRLLLQQAYGRISGISGMSGYIYKRRLLDMVLRGQAFYLGIRWLQWRDCHPEWTVTIVTIVSLYHPGA